MELNLANLREALQELERTAGKPIDMSSPALVILPAPRAGHHWEIRGEYAYEVPNDGSRTD